MFIRPLAAAIAALVSFVCNSTNAAETCGVSFSERPIVTRIGHVSALHAADLDGDGASDVLFSVGGSDDRIGWYENVGDDGRSFGTSPGTLDTAADNPESLEAADLDGDGDLDVLFASSISGWQENIGDGVFQERPLPTGRFPAPIAVDSADLNGDSEEDIVFAVFASGTAIVWHENLGEGVFSEPKVLDEGGGDAARSAHATDMDGDGDEDILSAFVNRPGVGWHETAGGGRFRARRAIGDVRRGSLYVHPADVDGGGDQDVVAAWSGISY